MKCCGFQTRDPDPGGSPFPRCPSRALIKLQRLFDRHAFWARGRIFAQLRRLLAGSDAMVSPWRGKRPVSPSPWCNGPSRYWINWRLRPDAIEQLYP